MWIMESTTSLIPCPSVLDQFSTPCATAQDCDHTPEGGSLCYVSGPAGPSLVWTGLGTSLGRSTLHYRTVNQKEKAFRSVGSQY